MTVLSGIKKIKENTLAIVNNYDFGQAIPNIRKYGLKIFFQNAVAELMKKPEQEKISLSISPEYIDWQNDYNKVKSMIADACRHGAHSEIRRVSLLNISDSELEGKISELNFYKNSNPLVSIIIPVYNNIKFTIECLLSIQEYTKEVSFEIIVADDCSTDDTNKILSRIKNIKYVRNTENLGFGLTCNRGAESAEGKYILILNNDVQVTANWLGELVKTFEHNKKVGAIGPKVLHPGGRLQEAGAAMNMDCSATLIGNGDDPALPKYNYEREVDYCSGVCLLVAAETFRDLKGFGPEFAPAYYEDVDLCFRLRYELGLKIMYCPKSVIIHHLSVTSESLDGAFKMSCVYWNRQKFAQKWQSEVDALNKVRLIAFYLPQFHPIPENDLWWGKGFTEWANVTKAKPTFEGHYQPHLPADLGFYDLRVEEVMVEQTELAKRYGIYGFCFYYYWFAGKRLLEMPIERMLKTNKPDIPFCLCWANENWTRRWDGKENEILMEQKHSDEDDQAVIMDVIRYMRHPNYIRIDGKPLFLLYRPNLFPDIRRTVGIWRDVCRKEGIGEIYLSMVESFEHSAKQAHPSQYGFDCSVEFPPHGTATPCEPPSQILNNEFTGMVSDYCDLVRRHAQQSVPDYMRFRGIMTTWDSTPRRKNEPHIFINSSPGPYQAWLEFIIEQTKQQNFGDERIIFINAWNEWAEGTHLEPDVKFGHGYLEATRNVLESWILKTGN